MLPAEEELEELKEEFRTRLGAADTTIQALKARRGAVGTVCDSHLFDSKITITQTL